MVGFHKGNGTGVEPEQKIAARVELRQRGREDTPDGTWDKGVGGGFRSSFVLFWFLVVLFLSSSSFFLGGVVSANLETVSCKETILEFCVLSGSFQIPIKINTPFA